MEEKRTYKPKYFQPYELLPEEMYTCDMLNNKEEAYRVLNEYFPYEFLVTLDIVREIIGYPLICNTWYQGGNRRYSGLRPKNCPVGAEKSQHKLGRAVDLICPNMSADKMRVKIITNQDKLPIPIRMEDGPTITWCHLDCKEMDYKGKKIYLFKG